jgi:hypothetical protein
MKKTPYIELVLVSAALAACARPAYWQSPGYCEMNDSTCSSIDDTCIYEQNTNLWYYSFRDFLNDFYYYYPSEIYRGELPVSSGFTKIIHHPGITRGGFGRTLAVAA